MTCVLNPSHHQSPAWPEFQAEAAKTESAKGTSTSPPPIRKPFLPLPDVHASQQESPNLQKNFPELDQEQVDVLSRGWDFFKQFDRLDLLSFMDSMREAKWAQNETDKLTQKWIEARKNELEKEASSRKWGVSKQVFTWMGSLTAIFTGIGLILTGVGAVAGAMMIAGGAIALTSQIMEITGAWKKIATLLPCNDPEKRAAIISWIQIGILVFSLALMGSGFLYSGFQLFSGASATSMACLGSVISGGQGITSIGKGIVDNEYYTALSEVKRQEALRAEKRHQKEEAVEKMESILKNEEGLNEFRQQYMTLLRDINDAFQMGLRL